MLESIKQPGDLRQLSGDQLTELAAEIRDFLVRAVAVRGGHLGSNLGVVELTIALHRVLDSPVDRIVWDTGHQAYVHKLLTGRQDDFAGLRHPRRAVRLPVAGREPARRDRELPRLDRPRLRPRPGRGPPEPARRDGRVVAVVGDGSLTGGVALEALNLIGHRKPDLLVILNDNGRSYAPTVGGLASHLAPFRSIPATSASSRASRRPSAGCRWSARAWSRRPSGSGRGQGPGRARAVFEDLGWQYAGPVDGHDLAALEKAIDHAKRVTARSCCTSSPRRAAATRRPRSTRRTTSTRSAPSTPRPGGPCRSQATRSASPTSFGQALLDEARRHPSWSPSRPPCSARPS